MTRVKPIQTFQRIACVLFVIVISAGNCHPSERRTNQPQEGLCSTHSPKEINQDIDSLVLICCGKFDLDFWVEIFEEEESQRNASDLCSKGKKRFREAILRIARCHPETVTPRRVIIEFGDNSNNSDAFCYFQGDKRDNEAVLSICKQRIQEGEVDSIIVVVDNEETRIRNSSTIENLDGFAENADIFFQELSLAGTSFIRDALRCHPYIAKNRVSLGLLRKGADEICLLHDEIGDVQSSIEHYRERIGESDVDVIAITMESGVHDGEFFEQVSELASNIGINYAFVSTPCSSATVVRHVKFPHEVSHKAPMIQLEILMSSSGNQTVCSIRDRIINNNRIVAECERLINEEHVNSLVVLNFEKPAYWEQHSCLSTQLQELATNNRVMYTYINSSLSDNYYFPRCDEEKK